MDKLSRPNEKLIRSWNHEMVRFPQSFTIDSLSLENSFGKDHTLVRDIIIFISFKIKTDLFNFARFSLSEFADRMKYDPKNLRRTLINYKGNTKLAPIYKDHTFDGHFDSVLFRMLKENVIVTRKFNGTYDTINAGKGYQIFTDLVTKKGKAQNSKVEYGVTLSENVLNSFIAEYNILSIDDYITSGLLNKNNSETMGGARNFYIFLCHALAVARHEMYVKKLLVPKYKVPLDEISEIFGHDLSREAKDRKRNITKLLDKLKKNLKLDFDYKYVGDRYKYYIEFSFSENALKLYDRTQQERFLTTTINRLNEVFKNLYRSENWFKEDTASDLFQRWLNSAKTDMERKIRVIKNSYQDIYNVKSDDISDEFCRDLITKGFNVVKDELLNYTYLLGSEKSGVTEPLREST